MIEEGVNCHYIQLLITSENYDVFTFTFYKVKALLNSGFDGIRVSRRAIDERVVVTVAMAR